MTLEGKGLRSMWERRRMMTMLKEEGDGSRSRHRASKSGLAPPYPPSAMPRPRYHPDRHLQPLHTGLLFQVLTLTPALVPPQKRPATDSTSGGSSSRPGTTSLSRPGTNATGRHHNRSITTAGAEVLAIAEVMRNCAPASPSQMLAKSRRAYFLAQLPVSHSPMPQAGQRQ